MKYVILSSILLILNSCSNTSELAFNIQFPKSSPILNQKQKIELKKNIAIKNLDLFTEEELKELLGELEIIIK